MDSQPMPNHEIPSDSWEFTEVEVRGHIIDSLILPKILDQITAAQGHFEIRDITIGERQTDPSYARLKVSAATPEQLQQILQTIFDHGAVPIESHDCHFEVAGLDGVFPEGFYSTTNQKTEIRIEGEWTAVSNQEMDCGVSIDPAGKTARCVPMSEVQSDDMFVVGHRGIRVFPPDRIESTSGFEFMNSAVSTEKPKQVAVRHVAKKLFAAKQSGDNVIVVAGPAVVHTGSGPQLCELIRRGFVDHLFAGNALATHDIEQSMFGTSLGVHLDQGTSVEAGHEHHLRAINRIRRAGGITEAIEAGLVTDGIMYECVKHDVDFVLAGSIRDDGPLPDVITDVLDAQRAMRERVQKASFCLMLATTLHSIAVGNLLPAWVHVVCVDINPSTVIKLNDRGSFQTTGIVTDVAPFLHTLLTELDHLDTVLDLPN